MRGGRVTCAIPFARSRGVSRKHGPFDRYLYRGHGCARHLWVVVSNERSPQAVALDIPVRNPSFLATHPSLPILYVVEELSAGEGEVSSAHFHGTVSGFLVYPARAVLGRILAISVSAPMVNSLRLPTTHQGVWWYSSWMTMAGSMVSQ